MTELCIAVDVMGGDIGPSVVIPAALQVIGHHPGLRLILVGDQEVIAKQLQSHKITHHPQLTIQHASQQVQMDESPGTALRNKKDSSMRVAINLVKEGIAKACVSAGNTGALMATAKFVLKTLPGVDRPALIARLPTTTSKTIRVLDLGANVDSKPEHLLQFAVMGSVLTSALDHIDRPTIGLLNIGAEEIKGNELVKQVATLLQNNSALNYVGYIEADEIFEGKMDVVVCDGFVGNVALKAGEGATKLFRHFIKESFQQNWLTRLTAILAYPAIQVMRKRSDPARFNGASLLGLQGIVIKSHGSANILGFSQAIEEAISEAKENVPQQIRDQVAKLLTPPQETSVA